jgi:hypothetical protein
LTIYRDSVIFSHKREYVLEVDLVVLASVHDEVNLCLQLSVLDIEWNLFLFLLLFVLVQVLDNIEETLKVAKGVIRGEL